VLVSPAVTGIVPFAPEDPYYGRYTATAKSLLDGREVMLLNMLFNLRVVVTYGPHSLDFEDAYCFHDVAAAWRCFETWDGESVPEGWAKNPLTGERGSCRCKLCELHEKL